MQLLINIVITICSLMFAAVLLSSILTVIILLYTDIRGALKFRRMNKEKRAREKSRQDLLELLKTLNKTGIR